ncbi:MAG: DNA/RNA nuclease SfsA, partial [Deltaproteobacteria bacterium]|nr:DNA/RNA nuclease SfsA [Deltaproteobacteria bacterium]
MNKNKTNSQGLFWPKLTPGTLVKRYKRFLADVRLSSGDLVTAHCANSGTMKECSEPGRPVYLSFSRLDLMLTKADRKKCFVEIKNCTLVKEGTAHFPDAVTTRGRKHLVELQRLAKEGNRSIIFFLVQ